MVLKSLWSFCDYVATSNINNEQKEKAPHGRNFQQFCEVNPAECVTYFDIRIEMINFESFLTIFAASVILDAAWTESKIYLDLKPNYYSTVKNIVLYLF